jgi:hypothetical protein
VGARGGPRRTIESAFHGLGVRGRRRARRRLFGSVRKSNAPVGRQLCKTVSSFVQHERESWEDGTFAVGVVCAAGSAACRIRLKVLQHICMLGRCFYHAASVLVTVRVEVFASGGADGLAGEGMRVRYDTLGHYTWSCCARGRGRSLRAAGQRAAGRCERVRRIREIARGE